MGRAYKNFWSLNPDEAVVTGILRDEVDKKKVEVLMPLNAQMKGIDLILINTKNKKTISTQVKGSRAYEPSKAESSEFENGSGSLFFLHPDTIHKAQADYFIFLVYIIEQSSKTGRRYIEPHTITIPAKYISKLSKKHKIPHPDRYSFYFWVNPKKKEAFDFKDKMYDVSKFLDKRGFEKLNNVLK